MMIKSGRLQLRLFVRFSWELIGIFLCKGRDATEVRIERGWMRLRWFGYNGRCEGKFFKLMGCWDFVECKVMVLSILLSHGNSWVKGDGRLGVFASFVIFP